MNNHDIELRLWDYIDGNLAVSERLAIEKLLAEQAEWREKYSELLGVSRLLQATELDQPSLRFSKNVMEEIGKYQVAPAAKQYINNKIIWSIGALFISTLLACLIYAFRQSGWSDAAEASPFAESIKSVNYSAFTDSNFLGAFLMVNVVLGLLLLDNYLNRNKKTRSLL